MALTRVQLIDESALDDAMEGVLEAGDNITVTHNAQTGKMVISASAASTVGDAIAFSIALS